MAAMLSCEGCRVEFPWARGRSKKLCGPCDVAMGWCSTCKRAKPREEFAENRTTRNGLNSECRTCRSVAWIQHKYDLSVTEYQELYDSQGGRCAICNQLPTGGRLCVDHNHDSGDVRGLLCDNCNKAIGLFQDSPEVIISAVEYIQAARKPPLAAVGGE